MWVSSWPNSPGVRISNGAIRSTPLRSRSVTGHRRWSMPCLQTTLLALLAYVLATMKDWASINHEGIAKSVSQCLWQRLFSHHWSHWNFNTVGVHNSLVLYSVKAKVLLKEQQTGKAVRQSYRWWSKWEIFHQLLVQFGGILPHLEEKEYLGTGFRNKLFAILNDV